MLEGMSKTKLFWIMSAGSAVLALIFALLPTSAQGASCGSVLVRSGDALSREYADVLSGRVGPSYSRLCADQKMKFLPFVLVFLALCVAFAIYAAYLRNAASSTPKAPELGGIASELAKLVALRDGGEITQAEFDEAKARLLQR